MTLKKNTHGNFYMELFCKMHSLALYNAVLLSYFKLFIVMITLVINLKSKKLLMTTL